MKARKWLSDNIELLELDFSDTAGVMHSKAGMYEFTADDIDVLIELLKSRWNDYEMVDITDNELLEYFHDIFSENYNTYAQLLQNYRKEYDYATGNKRIVTRNDNINIQGQRDIASKDNNKHTDYELPNKVTDDNYESTPSAIGKDASESESSNTYNNETSHSSSVETEYKNEFLDLKNKYLNQIRDVLREFANKFELCFQLVYDWRN